MCENNLCLWFFCLLLIDIVCFTLILLYKQQNKSFLKFDICQSALLPTSGWVRWCLRNLLLFNKTKILYLL